LKTYLYNIICLQSIDKYLFTKQNYNKMNILNTKIYQLLGNTHFLIDNQLTKS